MHEASKHQHDEATTVKVLVHQKLQAKHESLGSDNLNVHFLFKKLAS